MIEQPVSLEGLLNYRYREANNGETLVFLHSLAADHTIWLNVSARLPQFGVLLPDLPGHGRSPTIGNGFSIDDSAARVITLMRALDIDGALIVGLSIGGLIAQRICELDPEIVRGLVLCGTTYPDTTAEIRATMNAFAEKVEREGMVSMADFLGERWLGPRTDGETAEVRAMRSVIATTEARVVAAGFREVGAARAVDPQSLAGIPALILVAEHDPATTHEAALRLRNEYRRSEMIQVPAAFHVSPISQPQFVSSVVAKFVESITK